MAILGCAYLFFSLPQRTQRPNIEVNQYIYSKAQTAADLMREAQYEQRRAVLQGV